MLRQAKKVLKELEVWLCKWRLKMAPSKCQHTIFSNNNHFKANFDLKLFGETIPCEANPVSLGATFDPCLSFRNNVSYIKKKCMDRLNIVKILSHKSWGLSTHTQVALYRSLIGSVIDHSACMCSQLSDSLIKSVQAIQNGAMRSIFKMKYDAHTEDLCTISNLQRVEERMLDLNQAYIENAITSNNDLFRDLAVNYQRSFGESRTITKKTLLCDFSHFLSSVYKLNVDY